MKSQKQRASDRKTNKDGGDIDKVPVVMFTINKRPEVVSINISNQEIKKDLSKGEEKKAKA